MLSASLVYTDVQSTLVQAAPTLVTASEWITKAAGISPHAVTMLKKLRPLLTAAPQLAPLISYVSKDIAAVMQDAPQYMSIMNDTINILQKLPSVATQIVGPLHKLSELVKSAANDPALPAVIARLNTIIELNKSVAVVPSPTATSSFSLQKLVPALDTYIFFKKNPWVLIAAPVAITFLIGSIGFAIGRQ